MFCRSSCWMCLIFYFIYNMIDTSLFIFDSYCPFLICLLTQLEKSVRRFRETFHGKIAVEKATLLMRRYANKHQMVTWAVILKKGNGTEMVDSRCKPQSYHHRKPYGGGSKTLGPVLKSLYSGDSPLTVPLSPGTELGFICPGNFPLKGQSAVATSVCWTYAFMICTHWFLKNITYKCLLSSVQLS